MKVLQRIPASWVALLVCCLGSLMLSAASPGAGAPQDDARPAVLSHPVDLARPSAAFSAVNKALRESKCVRSEFNEEKRIKVLKRPLTASGTLVFSAQHGLYRATQKPFVQELLVTPARLSQRDASGRVERVDVEKQPLAKGFVAAFLLVFSGQDQALAEQFEIYFEGSAESWTMGFVPRKAPLSKFIASLVVTGKGAAFESLSVIETNGDRTLTRFTAVVTDKELSEDEQKRWFQWDG